MVEIEKVKEEKHLLKHDTEKKYQAMKKGWEDFMQVLADSQICMRSNWSTPKWWPPPKWHLPP